MNLISQPIAPDGSFLSIGPLTSGAPAVPGGFIWNKTNYQVTKLIESHKSYDQDRTHGSPEQYLRRHWYTFEMLDHQLWRVYFDRSKNQWILHSIKNNNV